MNEDLVLNEKLRLISKLTAEEKFCIEAYIVTGHKTLAYMCSRRKGSKALTSQSINTMAYKFFLRPEVMAFVELRENDLMNGNFIRNGKYNDVPDQNLNSNESQQTNLGPYEDLSKEQLLKIFTKLFLKETDTKLKSELGLKIADLQQWKRDLSEKIDTHTKFYLPVKCFDCTLFKNFKHSQDKKRKQAEEDNDKNSIVES